MSFQIKKTTNNLFQVFERNTNYKYTDPMPFWECNDWVIANAHLVKEEATK